VRMRTIIFNNVLPFGGGRKIDIFHCQVCSPVRERITILDVGVILSMDEGVVAFGACWTHPANSEIKIETNIIFVKRVFIFTPYVHSNITHVNKSFEKNSYHQEILNIGGTHINKMI
jgi:hypothetical protein